ncbi:TEA domain-containing protein [Mycena venus]|uniref:TEA domain-containing protein n=1 Tax=Mycena venus TaxID=2733690 RepID=A0A8H6XVP4_9AGAR|nr:TEA domain-containing protein [Mycena venus]
MAEIAAGFAGAASSIAAVRAATSAGFTGRHESTHRSELAEMDRNVHRYRSASQNGSEISFHQEDGFRKKLNASQESLSEYYRSLEDYKSESWFHLPSKIRKRRAVRRVKRAARDANQDLRECVDDISSEVGSDVSSLYAESGSPPGSALERERIDDWRDGVSADKDVVRGGGTVWPLDLEAALLEGALYHLPLRLPLTASIGLEKYRLDDSKEISLRRRNRIISDYIFETTGKRRSPEQVGSRLHQLRESCGEWPSSPPDGTPPSPGSSASGIIRLRDRLPPGSSASSDSPCNSPIPPLMDPRASPCSSHTVIYIDILPEDSPDDFSHITAPLPWPTGGDVIHVSDRPRRLRSIDPTVTFVSQAPIIAQSRFTVYSEDMVLHSETAPLVAVVPPSGHHVSGFLCSTALVPEYWKVISESPDPTRFAIYQEVVKKDPSTVAFSATYKFCYPVRHSSGFPSPSSPT